MYVLLIIAVRDLINFVTISDTSLTLHASIYSKWVKFYVSVHSNDRKHYVCQFVNDIILQIALVNGADIFNWFGNSFMCPCGSLVYIYYGSITRIILYVIYIIFVSIPVFPKLWDTKLICTEYARKYWLTWVPVDSSQLTRVPVDSSPRRLFVNRRQKYLAWFLFDSSPRRLSVDRRWDSSWIGIEPNSFAVGRRTDVWY